MDLTSLAPYGRQVIQSYKGGRFLISNIEYDGPVLVLPERTLAWRANDPSRLSMPDFSKITEPGVEIDILLIGCGQSSVFLKAEMRQGLSNAGVNAETMDTGAACRTFNVLAGENRRVAAALFPFGEAAI
ncbi:MAG: hypothetical protein HQ503_03855 [Rhodospirillales bacterium]|nr:hypothetical protein [Rhodospirillales bacterium]